jgi:hypothetical protein
MAFRGAPAQRNERERAKEKDDVFYDVIHSSVPFLFLFAGNLLVICRAAITPPCALMR